MPVSAVGRQLPQPNPAYGDEITKGARAFGKWRSGGDRPKPPVDGSASWPKGRKLTEEEFMASAPKRDWEKPAGEKPGPAADISNGGWGWAGGGATGNEALRKQHAQEKPAAAPQSSGAKIGPAGPKIYVRDGKVHMLSAAEVEAGLRQTAQLMGERGMAMADAAAEFAKHGYQFARYHRDYQKGAAHAQPAQPVVPAEAPPSS